MSGRAKRYAYECVCSLIASAGTNISKYILISSAKNPALTCGDEAGLSLQFISSLKPLGLLPPDLTGLHMATGATVLWTLSRQRQLSGVGFESGRVLATFQADGVPWRMGMRCALGMA